MSLICLVVSITEEIVHFEMHVCLIEPIHIMIYFFSNDMCQFIEHRSVNTKHMWVAIHYL